MNGHANGHEHGHGHANGNGHFNGNGKLDHDMFQLMRRSPGTTAAVARLRIGRVCLPGRTILDTPHYLANTSRGVVPHISQDTFVRDTDIHSVFVALEDCEWLAPGLVLRCGHAPSFADQNTLTV